MHPDLITRYNLSTKIPRDSETGALGALGAGSRDDKQSNEHATWSPSKQERQAILQRRREEMILAARRKLLEKDRAREKPSS